MMLSKIFTLAALAVGTDAFFRMECQGRLAVVRYDPMVNPGVPSGHIHNIHGSSGK